MSSKPKVLYMGHPIMYAHEEWLSFKEKFDIVSYDVQSREEAMKAFAEGGKYSDVEAIMRPSLASNILPSLDEELVQSLPSSLKIISYCNHGYDGEDTEALERRGIWYCNGAGGATSATADIALFLILAVFRYTTFCEAVLRDNKSADWFLVEDVVMASHDPAGHVLGIIGMGGIGEAVARRARSLGMNIHYHNRKRRPETEAALGDAVFHDTIESLLRVTDCIVVACPHTPNTHHLLNEKTLRFMKRGSRVVNVGRGKIIDEAALVAALEDGHISSAGLDVFYDEPVVHPSLLDNKKVALLPHMAGGTLSSNKNFEAIAMQNLVRYFFEDGKPLTPINNASSSCSRSCVDKGRWPARIRSLHQLF
ncbi:hypothetical protein F5Y10DRAFT_288507 [Nemania abortiva]|nr:hypothetical protein F5Y10DRAFT_288507 [Nemania abortiva]